MVSEQNYIWEESPYKNMSIAEIIHDYVVIRGDLSEPYARNQLEAIIEQRMVEAGHNGFNYAVKRIKELHHPVQYIGWRKWVMMFLREPRAYVPKWCRECGTPWPCATAKAIFEGQ